MNARIAIAVAAAVLLAALLTAGVAARKRRIASTCRMARALAEHAPAAAAWVRQAEADPFLGAEAMGGPVGSALALFREQALRAVIDLPSRFSRAEARAAYHVLSRAAPGASQLAAALEAIVPAAADLRCDELGPPAPGEGELSRLMAASRPFWASRVVAAAEGRREFGRDKEIYCRGESLLQGLRRMREVAAGICREAPPASRLAKGCAAGAGSSALEEEVSDLERQQELNQRKLRQKWPEGALQGLRC